MKVEAHELRVLLELANEMRLAKGDDLIEDLPISFPANSRRCLVANAFNYNCQVNPDEQRIIFQSKEDRDTYCKIVGIELDFDSTIGDWMYNERWFNSFEAPLTNDLCEIADNFDAHIYPQYEVPRDETGKLILSDEYEAI